MARPTLIIRLLRGGSTVAVSAVKGRFLCTGRDWRCDLVDPDSAWPRRKLLVRTFGGYRINLPDKAGGSFTYRGSTLTLDDMVAWGLAHRTRKGYLLRHRRGMTADIRIGDAKFLIDYGPADLIELAPEPVTAGHLPLRYRFQAPTAADLTFLTLLTLITIVHVAGVRSLRDYPIPEITDISELPRRISRLILEPAPPAPSQVTRQVETVGEGEAPALEGEREPEPEPAVEPETATPPPGDTPAPTTRESIRSQVSKMGVLGVLTGRGTAGRKTSGTGISVLQLDEELQQDLESVLGEIGGITTDASVAGTGGGAGLGGSEPGSGLIGIETKLSDSGVSGDIRVSGLGTGSGLSSGVPGGSAPAGAAPAEEYIAPAQREERSTRTIARVVAAHTGAIRYAYNRELRKKPSLRGKIILTFTISAGGDVIDCSVEESAMNWPPLEESLVRMVRTWKFPRIPEGDVTVSYPLVFFPSM